MFARACGQMDAALKRYEAQMSAHQGMNIDAFEKRWLEKFASGISQEDMEKYVLPRDIYSGCIWHIFSWKLLPEGTYLTGDEARRAYMEADKEGAVYIDGWGGEAMSRPLPHELYSPRVTDMICTEVYITAADFSWTYVKTHEDNWFGPYFYRKTQ